MRFLAALGLLLGAVWPAAQNAPVCPQSQTFQPGSKLTYNLRLHSELSQAGLTDSGQLDTTANVEFDVVANTAPDAPAEANMRFITFVTTVQAAPAALADLKAVAAEYAASALAMPAARLQLGRETRVVSRAEGDRYDQAVTMLQDLAYGGALPTRAVQVGDSWTVSRNEYLPVLHTMLPSLLQVKLTALDASGATLQVHSEGSVDLPLDQIPNRDAAMAAGLVPRDTVSFSSDATQVYRIGDGVLLAIASHSQNKQHLTFTGARTVPPVDQNVTSNSTIKLVGN